MIFKTQTDIVGDTDDKFLKTDNILKKVYFIKDSL